MGQSFFRDKTGRVVIWQAPNLALWLWIAAEVISRLIRSTIAAWLAAAFLFAWAFMELTRGVNYLRRLLGLVVVIWILVQHW